MRGHIDLTAVDEDGIRRAEMEHDVWSLATLVNNMLHDPHLVSEEDRLSLFVLGVQLTEEFGDQEEEEI